MHVCLVSDLTFRKLCQGHLQAKKWENAMTLDQQSWGYRRNMNLDDVISTKGLIKTLAETIR